MPVVLDAFRGGTSRFLRLKGMVVPSSVAVTVVSDGPTGSTAGITWRDSMLGGDRWVSFMLGVCLSGMLFCVFFEDWTTAAALSVGVIICGRELWVRR